jgi:hypothetical protein
MRNLIETVTVDGVGYNVAQAPAVKQKSLMSLIGTRIAVNATTAGVTDIDVDVVKGILISTPESDLDKIAAIVLEKCFISGTDSRVTVDNFQGGMNAYYTLLAEAVRVNLADFFIWLSEKIRESAEARKAAQAK